VRVVERSARAVVNDRILARHVFVELMHQPDSLPYFPKSFRSLFYDTLMILFCRYFCDRMLAAIPYSVTVVQASKNAIARIAEKRREYCDQFGVEETVSFSSAAVRRGWLQHGDSTAAQDEVTLYITNF
jgi:hypothetical protein